MKIVLVICVFLENCQGIADLSVWHQTLNTEGLFKNPKCYDQHLQGDWVCQGTKYKNIHPRATALASEIYTMFTQINPPVHIR